MEKNILFFCGMIVFKNKQQGIYIVDNDARDEKLMETLYGVDIYETCCNGALSDTIKHLDLIVEEEKRKQFITRIISIGFVLTQVAIQEDKMLISMPTKLLSIEQLKKEVPVAEKDAIDSLIGRFGQKKIADVLWNLQLVGEVLMKGLYNKTRRYEYN